MAEWLDSFGVEIEQGDTLLSSSTSNGMVKIGKADPDGSKSDLMMSVELVTQRGHRQADGTFNKRGAVGNNVVVLRKAAGWTPNHLWVLLNDTKAW